MLSSQQQKISSSHRERLALIYLRQSSPRQVRKNFRSTERQYSLAEEAVRLGWGPERVLTIDGDLGVSGQFSDTKGREAYKELVGRVCLGEVGAIFGLEVSRLARSSAETQRLLEYCGLTDTLVIDTDGIYDLRDFNDQLVLGVKGHLAQAELHVMGVRLQGAKRHAAGRGELRLPLPAGYLYDTDGDWIIDPDQEVQAAISDLLKAFRQAGSAYGVVGIFRGRRFPSRTHAGGWAGELRWGPLTYPRVLDVLSNPCYSGAYVFGRYRSRRVVRPDGTIATKKERLPRSEWTVVIQDHHPGYISWEEFLENEQRLSANRSRAGRRPPREGSALCQGIVRCGGCGHLMSTYYQRVGARYDCYRGKMNWTKTANCRSVMADAVDELVARRLLQALAPEEIALALAAADEHQDRRARANRALELRVERTRYEAIRAERAFHACEPDNRLVARSLEDRWERKLRELKDAEAEFAEHVVADSEPSREQLEALAHDLPALWAASTTAQRDRKRLLRTMIADVTLTSDPHQPEVRVGIRWQSGATEEHSIQRPRARAEVTRTPPQAVERTRQLAAQYTDAQIAEELNAAGLRTGHGHPFTARSVHWVRWAHKLPAPPTHTREGELSVRQVAETLGVSAAIIYDWITTGKLVARREPNNRLYISFTPEVEQQCRQRIASSSRIPQTKPLLEEV